LMGREIAHSYEGDIATSTIVASWSKLACQVLCTVIVDNNAFLSYRICHETL
jgi:hypothetical protein